MDDGPVALQRPRDPVEAGGQIYQGINITDSTAHLGPAYISHHHHYDDEDYRREILDDLSTLHHAQVHRRIQHGRLADTGSFLLESDEYLQWRDDKVEDDTCTHSLWCRGPPGVGKTFLASNVIDELRSRVEGQRYALLYLYANRDREFEQSVSSFLCHLARQLVEALPDADTASGLEIAKSQSRVRDGRVLPALLKLCLYLALRFERIYIVLDALDEFSEDPDDRLGLVDTLLSLQCMAEPGVFRLFKVASLQVDAIARQINRAGIMSALRHLAAQAEVYYQQALERIRKNDDFGPAVIRMLGWLLTLREPLLDEELAQAMGIALNTPLDTDPFDLQVHLPTLIDIAEGLVVSYPAETQPITFAHETVRAFIHSRLVVSGLTDWNADIARTYMRCLCLNSSVEALNEACDEEFDSRAFGLSSEAWYSLTLEAARSWPTYAAAAQEDISAFEQELALVDRGVVVLCCLHGWPSIARLLATSQLANPCETVYEFYSPLHVAISLGHCDAVKALLDAPGLGVDSAGLGANATESHSERLPVFSEFRLRLDEVEDELQSSSVEDETPSSSGDESGSEVGPTASEPPFTNAYVVQAFGTPPLHLAVEGPPRNRNNADLLQRTAKRHDSIMLKLFLERDEVDVNAVGYSGLTPLFIAIHNADVEAVRALLARRDMDVNLVTRSDHALSFTVHRLCFQRFVRPEKSLILGALVGGERSVSESLLEILTILLEHPSIEVNRPDVLGYTAMDWLNFYRSISANDGLHELVKSEREWVGSTGRKTAAMVLAFYENCRFPFDQLAKVLEEHGAGSSKSVDLSDWLKWFCPLPQRVYDEESDPEEPRRREEEGHVNKVFFLRVPFADGCEIVEGATAVEEDSDADSD